MSEEAVEAPAVQAGSLTAKADRHQPSSRDDLSDLEDGSLSPGAAPPLSAASPVTTANTSVPFAEALKQRTMKGFEWMKERTTAAAARVGEVAKTTGSLYGECYNKI
eukprot:scaffold36450_cov42-Prasinocladus_malaysianus.AAC.1